MTRVSLFFITFTQLLLWLSPGYTATYHCQDQTGTRVLTDNPAQLEGCSQLESSLTSAPQTFPTTPQHPEEQDQLSNGLPEQPSETTVAKQPHFSTNQENDITIPLQKIGGSYVAQVNLNHERTAHLIVDTGASMTVLSTSIGIDLGILGTTDNELLTVNTAGGSVQVNMNYLSTLSVGEAQASHVAVAIHDLPDMPEQIEGLLGMSFLKHFLITLDAEHARLILRPKPSS